MAMSLTKADLQAIKELIDGSIDERVPAIIDERVAAIIDERVPAIIDERVPALIKETVAPMFEEAIDDVKQHVAAGFVEVHEKLAELQDTVDTIQRTQQG